ncbi:OssF, partial [gut metagenome]
MKEKDKFILDIKRLGINGEGIGYYNKLAIFVKNAIPGEGVDIEIVKLLPNMAFGKVVSYKKQSPFRVTPKCEH